MLSSNPKIKGRWIILAVVIFLGFILMKSQGNNKELVKSEKIDKTEIQEIVKNYILNNPEVIINSLEDMQKRKIQEMKDKVQSLIQGKKTELENSTNSPFYGNEKGDITIVEFFDYKCGYCQKANQVLNEIVSQDAGVKVILKPLPILGEASEFAAKIALAVFHTRPDKFKAFHDDLIAMPDLNKQALVELSEKHGLEYSSLEDEMDKPEIKNEIQKIRDLAMEIEIHGAPAFIINGQHYAGLLEISKLQEIIKEARSKVKS